MTTRMRGMAELEGLLNDKSFGPYLFQMSALYDQFLATEIQVSGVSTAQLVGGVSPSIAAITEINFLLLNPNQNIKVGLHGVTASSAGWTLNANGVHITDKCSMTSLQVYNTASTTLTLFVVMGQT